MTDQNNNYLLASFELFNEAQALLDSLDSEYLYDYFRYLDYDHDYTEYYANKVHNAIHCDDIFNYNKFIKNGINVVCEEMIIKIGKIRVLLSHYPYKYGFWKSMYTNIKNWIVKGYWPKKNKYINYPKA